MDISGSKVLQYFTEIACFIMMILSLIVAKDSLPKEHIMHTIMCVFGFIAIVASFIITKYFDGTQGVGCALLANFLIIVANALPIASVGAISEVLIIYLPLAATIGSLFVGEKSGVASKVLVFAISIIYSIVSIYIIVNASDSLKALASESSYSTNTSTTIITTLCYGVFSLVFYILLLCSTFVTVKSEYNK